MIGRYVFSIAVGCLITLTLLFTMHLLIEFSEDAISKERTRHQLDFVRIKRNESLNTQDLTPEKPAKPPEVPPTAPPQDLDSIDPNAPTIAIPAPTVAANVDIGGPGGMNIAEGDYLPIVRDDETPLTQRVIELAALYEYYGTPRIIGILGNAGWRMNHKSVGNGSGARKG